MIKTEELKVGDIVALRGSMHIGKVLSKKNNEFWVNYYDGAFQGPYNILDESRFIKVENIELFKVLYGRKEI